MEEDREDLTPFWLQTSTNRRRTHRIRSGLSSLIFSSGLLVIFLLLTAVCFVVFVVPSTLSLSVQIFRPNTVKKSWDSLNLVLVLFALVFGFLSRIKNKERNYDDYPLTGNDSQKSNPSTPQQGWAYNYSTNENEAQKSNPSTPHHQWYGYSDQMMPLPKNKNSSISSRVGLRRTSSSYPDLLEASSSQLIDPWRFYDDMRVDTYRVVSDSGQILHRRRIWKDNVDALGRDLESKNVYVDKFLSRPKEASYATKPPSPPPPANSPPSPPSLPPSSPEVLPKEKPKRVYQSVGHKRERRGKIRKDDKLENRENISLPVTPPAPPHPPPPPPQFVDQKAGRSDKKRSGASATKDFLNSLYPKKKKKQRQKSVENFDVLLYQSQTPPPHFQLPPPSPPLPPPPPPPPPSVFHNLFPTKKSKRKNTDLDIFAPTPSTTTPPPPPPLLTEAIASEPATTQNVPVVTNKSPKSVKVTSFYSVEENSNSGGESPLIPIPPPPPPPPFAKSVSWKFVVQGDYVRVDSTVSSRSGSPDPDDVESDGTPTAINDGDAPLFPPSPRFCPSPDVNTKAENFISTFRAGLKLEKINSMEKRQVLGLSNLGRCSDPTQL